MCNALMELMKPNIDEVVDAAVSQAVDEAVTQAVDETTKSVTKQVTQQYLDGVTKYVLAENPSLSKREARKKALAILNAV